MAVSVPEHVYDRMSRRIIRLSGGMAAAWLFAGVVLAQSAPDRLTYPESKRVDVVDEYHGMSVADPYRWLEDADCLGVRSWIEAQNELTTSWLGSVQARRWIHDRLTHLWDYERFGTPEKHGGRYFFTRQSGLQNQPVLYVLDSLNGQPRVLLDPNLLSEDGTVALAGWYVSDDGRRMAYALSAAGSDWMAFRVRQVDCGTDLPDRLEWIKFSGASWSKDGAGFYYSRYDEPPPGQAMGAINYFQKLYYHRLGTPQADDELILHFPDHKEWGVGGRVSDDGRYLLFHVRQGTDRRNRLYYVDLEGPGREVVRLLDDFDASYRFIDNDGPVFWLLTDLDAPLRRVIAIDTRSPERNAWKELIPEAAERLQSVSCVGGEFLASYLKDAHTHVRRFDLAGRPLGGIDLPGLGSAGGFAGRRGDGETFYYFSSFTTPTTIYRYDVAAGQSHVFRRPRVDFNPEEYQTRQIFYTSKDGTRVPMFITHRSGLTLDGGHPTVLGAYGGFGISRTPWFSVENLVWMELGGICVVANIRGGGEYGNAWHDAGRLAHKQNGFDDFMAAAEWLASSGYTRPERLAITGRSNGGLLVGACITQRPELFGAALPGVGVFDMLRFHRYTIGWAWIAEYGSPDDPAMFNVLHAYSPLHRIRPGRAYPPTLITTGDHDDRVVPAHSFKFGAALQAAQAGPAPVLIRIETRAGHGAGTPTAKIIDEAADRWAFLVRTFDIEVPPPAPAAASR